MKCTCNGCPHHQSGRSEEPRRVTVAIWKDGERLPLGRWVGFDELGVSTEKDLEIFRLLAQSLFQGAVRHWLRIQPPALVIQSLGRAKQPLSQEEIDSLN